MLYERNLYIFSTPSLKQHILQFSGQNSVGPPHTGCFDFLEDKVHLLEEAQLRSKSNIRTIDSLGDLEFPKMFHLSNASMHHTHVAF